MYNLGDDRELDRLSREAAGKYVPPDTANWETLSAELDKVMPVEEKKRRFLFFWWLLPLLLIGGGLAYWQLTKEDDSAVTVSTTKQTAVVVQADKKENTVTAQPGVTKEDHSAQTVSAQNDKKENTAATQSEIIKDKVVQDHLTTAKTSATTETSGNKAPATAAITKQSKRKASAKEENNTIASGNGSFTLRSTGKTKKTSQQENNQSAIIPAISKTADQPVTEQPATIITVNPTIDKGELTKQEIAKTNTDQPIQVTTNQATKETITEPVKESGPETTEITPKKDKPPVSRGRGWSYQLLLGVDKSTVKFRYGNDPGYNMGVMGGYHFNDRLSIHSGAIFTQKNYKLAGEDFTAPKGSWVNNYKIENITGYCRMWEVPLLLRYTIRQNNKNSIFLSTGLSSYFMTSENYNYFYYYNGQPVTRNSSYSSTDTHVLSIAHLSVGFENRISQNWALQVEPYAKIPLGGVGFGNIRLSSFGVNFSVQHRQPSKK